MVGKITVVGAGHVGATAAQGIARRSLAREVVMVDIVEGIPQGKGLDMYESAPIEGWDTRIVGANDYDASAGSSIVIITAGLARKPGMSRDDLLMKNTEIVSDVAKNVKETSPDAILIMVSNPLDIMAYVAKDVTGFPKNRVIGMAGVLDTARYRTFLSMEMGVSVEDIQALVMGGHGDSMVPVVSMTTVSGIPVTHFVQRDRLEEIINRTRKGGGEIVGHLKTGSAYYAPGAASAQMAEAIVLDKKRILPCAAWLEGEYGIDGLFLGVPCKLGANGIEEIIEVDLTDDEQSSLEASAAAVRETMNKLG